LSTLKQIRRSVLPKYEVLVLDTGKLAGKLKSITTPQQCRKRLNL